MGPAEERSSPFASGGAERSDPPLSSLSLRISSQVDVERARRAARGVARRLGLDREMAEACALTTSELATNLVRYARDGEVSLGAVVDATGGLGFEIEARDRGPGIADLDQAMRDGFSSGGGLGGGLGAARRLMDEFEISTSALGTRVIARKWTYRH